MGMSLEFPSSMNLNQMAIRGIYVKYNHLSDTCKSYYVPRIPKHYKKGKIF